jgi:hypothetical protein
MVAEEEAPHLGGDMEDGRRVVEVFWSAISHLVLSGMFTFQRTITVGSLEDLRLWSLLILMMPQRPSIT